MVSPYHFKSDSLLKDLQDVAGELEGYNFSDYEKAKWDNFISFLNNEGLVRNDDVPNLVFTTKNNLSQSASSSSAEEDNLSQSASSSSAEEDNLSQSASSSSAEEDNLSQSASSSSAGVAGGENYTFYFAPQSRVTRAAARGVGVAARGVGDAARGVGDASSSRGRY